MWMCGEGGHLKKDGRVKSTDVLIPEAQDLPCVVARAGLSPEALGQQPK